MTLLALGMDLLLASLLTAAVIIGVRLNGRLKGLRQGQDQFVAAVADLDAAAAKAERALSALKSASEEAHDALMARIETARALTRTLETATADAHSAARRAQESERPQPSSSLSAAARSPLAGEAAGQAPGQTAGQTFGRPSGDVSAPALSLKAALHRASQSRGSPSSASPSLTSPFRASSSRARDVQVSQPEASSPASGAQPDSPRRRTSGAGDQPLPPLGERRRAMEARFPPLLGTRGVRAPAALAEPIAGRPLVRPPARPTVGEKDDLFDDSLWPAASLNPSTGRAR
jgi:hypothetical protein